MSMKSNIFNDSNFISVFLKAACHGNPGAELKFSGSK